MAELKTNRNKGDVEAFLKSVPDEKKRRDSFTILELMKQVTGKERRCGAKASSALAAITTSTKAGSKATGL